MNELISKGQGSFWYACIEWSWEIFGKRSIMLYVLWTRTEQKKEWRTIMMDGLMGSVERHHVIIITSWGVTPTVRLRLCEVRFWQDIDDTTCLLVFLYKWFGLGPGYYSYWYVWIVCVNDNDCYRRFGCFSSTKSLSIALRPCRQAVQTQHCTPAVVLHNRNTTWSVLKLCRGRDCC